MKGVLVVDSQGLTIENMGDFDPAQSGIVSSIMRNVAQLSKVMKSI